MYKEFNGEKVLVDVNGRPAPEMPSGWMCVLIDNEWVARKTNNELMKEMAEITLKDVTVMIAKLTKLYPTRFKPLSSNDIRSTSLAWYDKVKGLERDKVIHAFEYCTNIMSTPPVPADILKAITKMDNGSLHAL